MGTRFNQYYKTLNELHRIVWDIKFKIIEHWKDVDDWSGLELLMTEKANIDGEIKQHQIWYGPDDFVMGNSDKEYFRSSRERIETVEDIVLDECDGDFSITINGITWFWIGSEAVVNIWDYIEKKLELEV
jgi:hypothetical protein